MDIITIGFTIAAWTKYGSLAIKIIALICALFEAVGGFYLLHKSDGEDGVWGAIVGAICLVLAAVKLFGAKQ